MAKGIDRTDEGMQRIFQEVITEVNRQVNRDARIKVEALPLELSEEPRYQLQLTSSSKDEITHSDWAMAQDKPGGKKGFARERLNMMLGPA